MRAIVFSGAGSNEVVKLHDRPDPTPDREEVLVQVVYAGLNPADLQQRAGRYPAPAGATPDVPGLEVAGTVLDCGEDVHEWQIGDRVMGLVGGGGLADRVIVHRRHLVQVPDAVNEQSAAAVPEAFVTAHDAIRTQAQLMMGETLLVHGANGGVGSAAVQIATAAGARVLGTSRSASGRAFVAALGGDAIITEEWPAIVDNLTAGEGVDVILELVGAPNFPANIDALRPLGRIIVIGIGSGAEAALPLGSLLAKRASIRGSGLRYRSLEEKAVAIRAFEREVLPHLASGRISAQVDRVFSAEDVTAAFDHLETASKRGKVLIRFGR